MVSFRRMPPVVAMLVCGAPSATPRDVYGIEICDSTRKGRCDQGGGRKTVLEGGNAWKSALSGSRSCVTLCAVLSSEGWLCDVVAAWARLVALDVDCRVFWCMGVVKERGEGCRRMRRADSTRKRRMSSLFTPLVRLLGIHQASSMQQRHSSLGLLRPSPTTAQPLRFPSLQPTSPPSSFILATIRKTFAHGPKIISKSG